MAEKKYIELEAAISSLDELEKTSHHNSVLWPDHVEECREALRSIPATDVQPVRKGRWEYNPGDNIPYCSECMMPQDTECNFCPSCGADMR